MTTPLVQFETHRALLYRVAYSILGTAADADDAVQDSWLRWSADSRADVDNPRGYLVQVVTRVSLNRLRSLRARRESYVGPWLPEPLLTEPDGPAEHVERADSVSMALLVVLESLSPLERAVFALRDLFGYSHREVADIVDRSETAVRQISSRARAHVRARRPRFDTDPAVQREATQRFAQACATGDVGELLTLLAPDVTFISDGGGRVSAALRPVVGAEKVARLCLGLAHLDIEGLRMELREVNGQAAVVGWVGDAAFVVLQLDVVDGVVEQVFLVRNPDKLRHLAP
ncbi:MAG: RNA polymerase sigma-70 factor [Propionibacteriaceae bacterium]